MVAVFSSQTGWGFQGPELSSRWLQPTHAFCILLRRSLGFATNKLLLLLLLLNVLHTFQRNETTAYKHLKLAEQFRTLSGKTFEGKEENTARIGIQVTVTVIVTSPSRKGRGRGNPPPSKVLASTSIFRRSMGQRSSSRVPY